MKSLSVRNLILVGVLVTGSIFSGATVAQADDTSLPMTISPNPVLAGDDITFSGVGCLREPGDPEDFTPEVILLDEDDDPAPAIIPATDGTWSATYETSPYWPAGDYSFTGVCDLYNSSIDYAATLKVTANLIPPSGIFLPAFLQAFGGPPILTPGATYEVEGYGFTPTEPVELILHSAPVILTAFTADSDGSVDGNFTVPSGTAGGSHTLSLLGLESGAAPSVDVVVIPPPVSVTPTVIATATKVPAPSTTSSSSSASAGSSPSITAASTITVVSTATSASAQTLAATGANAALLIDTGMGLAAFGAGLLFIARRRPRRSH